MKAAPSRGTPPLRQIRWGCCEGQNGWWGRHHITSKPNYSSSVLMRFDVALPYAESTQHVIFLHTNCSVINGSRTFTVPRGTLPPCPRGERGGGGSLPFGVEGAANTRTPGPASTAARRAMRGGDPLD